MGGHRLGTAMIIKLTGGGIDADHSKQLQRKRNIQAFTRSVRAAMMSRAVPLGKFPKNVTNLGLPWAFSVLHIVCPQGRLRYYLLLTGIHRLLAPLFTIIRIY